MSNTPFHFILPRNRPSNAGNKPNKLGIVLPFSPYPSEDPIN